MLLVHGGLGLDHSLLRAHDDLADQLELVYYDHRGHGRSDREWAERFDIAMLHDDADALLSALGHERAVVLGHSYGAWIALGFALRYPHRVAALILVGGAAVFDYAADAIQGAIRRDPACAAALVDLMTHPPSTDGEFAAVWPKILPLYFHRFDPSFLVPWQAVRYCAAAYATGARLIGELDMLARVDQLACPTLLVVGDDDFITPPSQSHRIAARAPDAEVVTLAGCGHFPQLEQPSAYLAAVRAWLTRRGFISQ